MFGFATVNLNRRERLATEIQVANAPFMTWQEALQEADFWLGVQGLALHPADRPDTIPSC